MVSYAARLAVLLLLPGLGPALQPDQDPHLYELYGGGERDIDPDKHFASSVEGLARLYHREQRFVHALQIAAGRVVGPSIELTAGASGFPGLEEFLGGTVVGLYRIQTVYNVSFHRLVQGELGELHSPHRLTAKDCFLVAGLARHKNDLQKNVEWLQVAASLTAAEGGNLTLVSSLLARATQLHDQVAIRHGKYVMSRTHQYTLTRIEPFDEQVSRQHRKTVDRWKKQWKNFQEKFPMFQESKDAASLSSISHIAHMDKIAAQCQQKPDSPFLAREGAGLLCSHLHKGDPRLRLGPLRLEPLSSKPAVGIFRGFLTDIQCSAFIEKGRGKMKTTPLSVPATSTASQVKNFTDERLSKIRYLSHNHFPPARKLNDRLNTALELQLNADFSAENYQLMNYGIGGWIGPHVDSDGSGFATDYDKNPELARYGGERLMTFMVYLTTVAAGGNTVFPLLGLSVPPRRGDALFWHTVSVFDISNCLSLVFRSSVTGRRTNGCCTWAARWCRVASGLSTSGE